jgi:hypothetical protein
MPNIKPLGIIQIFLVLIIVMCVFSSVFMFIKLPQNNKPDIITNTDYIITNKYSEVDGWILDTDTYYYFLLDNSTEKQVTRNVYYFYDIGNTYTITITTPQSSNDDLSLYDYVLYGYAVFILAVFVLSYGSFYVTDEDTFTKRIFRHPSVYTIYAGLWIINAITYPNMIKIPIIVILVCIIIFIYIERETHYLNITIKS